MSNRRKFGADTQFEFLSINFIIKVVHERTLLNNFIQASHSQGKSEILLELLLLQEQKNGLDENVLSHLKRLKTKEWTHIAIIGLLLWQASKNISDNWQACLLELKSEHFWDWENNSNEIADKIDNVPFDLLVRLFWGIGLVKYSIIDKNARQIFKHVDLVSFLDIINIRKSYVYDDKLQYFYHERLNLVSDEQVQYLNTLTQL
jgi:hypothetical protein